MTPAPDIVVRASPDRLAELAAGLQRLEQRLAAACAAARREREQVTLIAVTKFFPVGDVLALHELGVRDVGESRDQDAATKAAALRDAGLAQDLRWHFVGRLQTNKAKSVATYADLVHSVDRPQLLDALSGAAERAGRVLDVLLQVSLDTGTGADTERGGSLPADLPALADAAAGLPALRLRGLMALAPPPGALGGGPGPAFARLAELATRLQATHPQADLLSAGMSGDLEAAVAAGATHVRVGTALLGERPPPGG